MPTCDLCKEFTAKRVNFGIAYKKAFRLAKGKNMRTSREANNFKRARKQEIMACRRCTDGMIRKQRLRQLKRKGVPQTSACKLCKRSQSQSSKCPKGRETRFSLIWRTKIKERYSNACTQCLKECARFDRSCPDATRLLVRMGPCPPTH